ncbi:MAG: 4-hydroxy-tetrahydrodipicolinate reductase [Defluviitaleaceae bacterium]|nr:4-hydroxy-tetrahydrodipicolinate reductase [Defluviitaleaceae bacterium]MCL2262240.1 4-hydroxy-tetrahydrodipicolinate reductase [Defluviitaleaceae bacterium]
MKIIVCGCFGRMGEVVCKLAAENPGTEVVAGVDLPEFAKAKPSFPVYRNINEFTAQADAIINFMPPTAEADMLAVLDYGVKRGIPMVICTTGMPLQVETAITNAAQKAAVLRSGNMSMGINLLANLLKRISPLLHESGFDIEIIEKHHNQKLDAPSGTALLLADSINTAMEEKMQYVNDRSATHAKRTRDEIGFHAIRGGTIVGEHSIVFAGHNEVIELKHSAQSREVFAVGALKAAEFLQKKSHGLYTMQDLME